MATNPPGDGTMRILIEIRDHLRKHDERFDAVDQRFDAVDQRFGAIDQRFDAVDERSDAVDQRFDRIEAHLCAQDERLDEHGEQLSFLGVTLSQVLRAVRHGNALRDERVEDHERRIKTLEGRGTAQP